MDLKRLLTQVAEGRMAPGTALRHIEATRERNLGFARVDMDRLRRRGLAEVIFCQGKTPEQVARIVPACDGVILGSALAGALDGAAAARLPEACRAFLAPFRSALDALEAPCC